MYSISISFGPVGTTWRLLFKSKENFEEMAAGISDVITKNQFPEHLLELADEYGQKLSVRHEQIHAIMYEDLDQAQLAQVEMTHREARTQNLARQRVEGDPSTRGSVRGPSVITPMGMNGAR